jgi:hypothetical protein
MEPFKGAERDGIAGFGKGIVRGVVGVALKPVVGVFDFGARTFEVRTWQQQSKKALTYTCDNKRNSVSAATATVLYLLSTIVECYKAANMRASTAVLDCVHICCHN